ncbi:hypothetical protein ACJMK2_015341 [Sinanodonta woodiana]|uniref:Uncharacterized protein n=1 Tax=Sinanodonta woodiana TaxID=1069815 RepID=A0ABD3UPZ1_SINWO
MAPCECSKRYLPTEYASSGWAEPFASFKDAFILSCSDTGLTEIPDFNPVLNKSINAIWLSHNKIKVVEEHSFQGMKLSAISLDGNPLERVHRNAFSHMANSLESLTLGRTRLHFKEGIHFLEGLTNLRELDLSYTKHEMEILPSNFFRPFNVQSLVSLERLVLSGMEFSDIEIDTFVGMETIKSLEMCSLPLQTIPNALSRLTELRHLDLTDGPPLNITRDAMKHFKYLQHLQISRRGLKSSPGHALQELDSLVHLDLSDNDIRDFGNESFSGKYKLRTLIIGGNPTHFTDNMFQRIEMTLDHLDISRMELTELPLKSLRKLKKLQILVADENLFKSINADFFSGLKLKHISINNVPHLMNINDDAFMNMKSPLGLSLVDTGIKSLAFIANSRPCLFGKVKVGGTSIPCDCQLEKLLHSGIVTDSLSGSCSFPGEITKYWFITYNGIQVNVGGYRKLNSRLVSVCGHSKLDIQCPLRMSSGHKQYALSAFYVLISIIIIFMHFTILI